MKAYHIAGLMIMIWLVGLLAASLAAGDLGGEAPTRGVVIDIPDQGDRGFFGNLLPNWMFSLAYYVWSPVAALVTVIGFGFGGTVLPGVVATIFTIGFSFTFLWIFVTFIRGGGTS